MTLALTDDLRADLEATGAASRFVRAAHGRLHALDFGGSGPDVLVLPGITTPAVCFAFAIGGLRDAARFVVADVRGRGLSTPSPDGDYALETYADDADALVAGLELDRPVVLGHSMGARIAAAVAVRHPDAVRSLLLADPPLSGPGRAPYPTSREAFVAQLHEAQAGTTGDAVARHWPGWPPHERELRARWLPTCDEGAVVATHRGFESEDFRAWWRAIPVPTVLVRGGRSPVVTEEGARELAQARPDIRLAVVPEAGHMIPWDDPDGWSAVVRDALIDLTEGGPG